jgi:hypothetical protein
MNDRHHEPAQVSSGEAAHVPLAPLAPSFSSPQRPTAAPSACRRPSIFNHPAASHGRHVDAFTDWIVQRVDQLVALDRGLPLVVPLTVTFSLGSTRPDQVLREYERFYARLCDLLVNNHGRPSKRHLLPFALAFRDDPSTRPDKYRDRPSAHAVFSCHPTRRTYIPCSSFTRRWLTASWGSWARSRRPGGGYPLGPLTRRPPTTRRGTPTGRSTPTCR